MNSKNFRFGFNFAFGEHRFDGNYVRVLSGQRLPGKNLLAARDRNESEDSDALSLVAGRWQFMGSGSGTGSAELCRDKMHTLQETDRVPLLRH
jgi:hypothetical protein